jgi:hypothetical protein
MDTNRRIALLGLLGVAGEDNEARLVRFETLNVESLALLAQVSPSVVDNDTNTTSRLAADTSFLQLSQSETTALPDLAVVANSLSTNSRAEELEGAHTEGSGLNLAGLTTAELASGLVEPGAHT